MGLRQPAAIALILLVLAATLGMAARLYIPNALGQGLFVLTRIGMIVLPIVWWRRINQGQIQVAWPTRRDAGVGLGLGLVMMAVIAIAYWTLGRQWIDPEVVRAAVAPIGLLDPKLFILSALYFTFINAFLEEYIWRWFVYRNCAVWVSGISAIALSALLFTLHHIIALAAYTDSLAVVVIGSLGVFLAGTVWSSVYLAYQSLWVCTISHVLADAAIALIGWQLLFG